MLRSSATESWGAQAMEDYAELELGQPLPDDLQAFMRAALGLLRARQSDADKLAEAAV